MSARVLDKTRDDSKENFRRLTPEDAVKRSLLEIYAYAVCFFVTVYVAFVIPAMLWDGVHIIAPEFDLGSYYYDPLQSDEAFQQQLIKDNKNPAYEPPVGSALTEMRARLKVEALASERRNATRRLVEESLKLLVVAIIFAVHWRMARRAAISQEG